MTIERHKSMTWTNNNYYLKIIEYDDKTTNIIWFNDKIKIIACGSNAKIWIQQLNEYIATGISLPIEGKYKMWISVDAKKAKKDDLLVSGYIKQENKKITIPIALVKIILNHYSYPQINFLLESVDPSLTYYNQQPSPLTTWTLNAKYLFES